MAISLSAKYRNPRNKDDVPKQTSLSRHGRSDGLSGLPSANHVDQRQPSDLEERAKAAFLIGKAEEGSDLLARAHQQYIVAGRVCDAARCAFWLGFTALLNGENAQANGWLARSERLLADQPDCVEKGYLLLPTGYRGVHGSEPGAAVATFERVAEIGRQFHDCDLTTLGLQGQGRALIRSGEVRRGVTLLDEAMIAVTAGEVSPLVAGGVYCSVLDACGEIFDMRRAQEWTAALEKWCESQPDVVPYRGHCRLRRAEILELHGAWNAAMDEASLAIRSFNASRAAGAAVYRIAELHRLRGEFDAAEKSYQQAAAWGRSQPGHALLRLGQGDVDAANAAIRRELAEVHEPSSRVRVLETYLEIVLAAKDVDAARKAAEELLQISKRNDAPLLHAVAARAMGSVLLAEHSAEAALAQLRASWNLFNELDAPYEAARTRVLLARACRQLKDEDAAASELNAARAAFQQLGAQTDLLRVESLLRKRAASDGKLTDREIEVLRLIASGITNRGIAGKLRISEKTVARHVSNIFVKLDLSSRAAATAYAFQHGVI
jgi:DNA-binding NarL/FixJ family response regulator